MAPSDVIQRLTRVLELSGVPPRDAAFLRSGLDEVASYATEAELLADTSADDGTIAYAQDTGWFFFRRDAGWEPAPNASSGVLDQSTAGNLNIPIAVDGYDGPAANEVVFRSQADVDAYLTSKSATALKYVTKVWDYAIPQYARHTVRFYLGAGVHRPENPLPAGAQAAWDFCRRDLPPHVFLESGYLSLAMGPTSDYYDEWEKVPGFTGDYVCTAHSGSGSGEGVTPPSVTCAGENFGPDNKLIGYYVVAENANVPRAIIGNSGDTIYLAYRATVQPDTIRILSPSAVMRNSYDDATKVKTTMFKVDLIASDSGQPRVNFDSLRLDQMGAATGVAIRDSVLDMYAVLFDHARQKNDFGVTETFGNCITEFATSGRAHIGGQLWSVSMRSNVFATTPGSGLTVPILFGAVHSRDIASRLALSWGVAAGFNSAASYTKGSILFGSFRFIDCAVANPLLSLQDMVLQFATNQIPLAGFVRCAGGVAMSGCDVTGDASNNALVFDGQTANYNMLAFVQDNKTISGPLRVKQGLAANAGRPVAVIGPRNNLQFSPSTDLAGSGGNVDISDTDYSMGAVARSYTWGQLDDLRYPRNQPGGTLLGAVEVLGVEPVTTIGAAASLQYTATGTLLAYKEHGDSGYGTGIDVSSGGVYTLASASGKTVQVLVHPTLLPGADSTQSFEVTRGFVDWRWTQNRIARRYA